MLRSGTEDDSENGRKSIRDKADGTGGGRMRSQAGSSRQQGELRR